MSLLDKVHINTHYTRSINLERDANSIEVIKAYIPTNRALKTLIQIRTMFNKEDSVRAWSLVGSYGSGKSAFSVFLSQLLNQKAIENHQAAINVLKQVNKNLAESYLNAGNYCCVLLTGSPEPLVHHFVHNLLQAAKQYFVTQDESVISELEQLSKISEPAISDVMKALKNLQQAIADIAGGGILIVIDELGKFLEYEVRHNRHDIYLLQQLAEHAQKGHTANLNIVVLLHQNFEQYAKNGGENLKHEWAKIQGRFEQIPFLESTEQTLRVVAVALNIDDSITVSVLEKIQKQAKNIAKELANNHALIGTLNEQSAARLFNDCYPLHPVSALLLPILCQKLAQNERTLFSYLGSNEPHGFKDSLSRCQKLGDWIYPHEIYDYFIANQTAMISNHFTHRRWAEVVTALERLTNASLKEVQLLKTIGLLNIINAQAGFKASKAVLALCLPTKNAAKAVCETLSEKSIITYQGFNHEYRVWQGSDFDLEAAIIEQRQLLGFISLSEQLNNRHHLLPIVARKYSIETGALRYFIPYFTDSHSYQSMEKTTKNARIIFYLSETQADQVSFELVKSYCSKVDIVVFYENSTQLRDKLIRVLALEHVRKKTPELNSDPIAMREFKDHYENALSQEKVFLNALIDSPQQHQWFCNNQVLEINNKRALQTVLSKTLKQLYYFSPIIKNELINKDNPSPQVNSAKRKLLVAMLTHSQEADLGIEKFPAEKSIYRALLQASGLHRKVKGEWQFCSPNKEDSNHFKAVWQRLEDFLEQSEPSPLAFTTLNQVLNDPPYGIKAGVLPILYFAIFLAYQHELALYEEGIYVPYPSVEHIERFSRSPERFSVQRFRIEGMRLSIFKEYTKALYENKETADDLLSIVRPLAKFMDNLPEYTKKTKCISDKSQQVRNTFSLAKSPEKLLFEVLPKACGLPIINPKKENGKDLEGFAETLTNILRELKYAYPNMLKHQCELICSAFNYSTSTKLKELRHNISGRFSGLEDYTIDEKGVRGFIVRVINIIVDDNEWLNSLLIFLANNKSPQRWQDSDLPAVEFSLKNTARHINDLENLRVYYAREKITVKGEIDVFQLKTLGKNKKEHSQFVSVNSEIQKVTKPIKDELMLKLNESTLDKELKLALLAELVDEFLIDYESVNASAEIQKEVYNG